MKLRIDVFHHFPGQVGHSDQVLQQLLEVRGDIAMLNANLTQALSDLQAEVADSVGKANSILTYVQGVPGVVAAAVAKALADADVEEARAAELVNAARQSVSDAVDGVVAAVNANAPPNEEPVPSPEQPAPTEGGGTNTEGGGTNDGGQPQ